MLKIPFIAIAALFSTFSVFAATSPSHSIDQFCSDRSAPNFSQDLAENPSNLMAFRNVGGIANGGVCWWHSRFQRNALYLTIYAPAEPKPTKEEAEKIITKIRSGNEVVEIPGFSNFNEFSYVHRDEIQRELEKWQKSDGIIKFGWVIGLMGKTGVAPEKLKEMMDELYQYVEVAGNIAYQKLQIKGVTAHAWLVVKMKMTKDGYDLDVIDSNMPTQTNFYQYHEGQTNFSNYLYGDFTPYLERKGEMEKINETISKTCQTQKVPGTFSSISQSDF